MRNRERWQWDFRKIWTYLSLLARQGALAASGAGWSWPAAVSRN